MGIYTFGITPFNFRYPKINGIQWDYSNGNQWENLPMDSNHNYDENRNKNNNTKYKTKYKYSYSPIESLHSLRMNSSIYLFFYLIYAYHKCGPWKFVNLFPINNVLFFFLYGRKL